MTTPFGQLITAMVTPFTPEGKVNYDLSAALAAHLVAQGSDGLVICGTTGESPTLTWEEEFLLFQVVQQAIGGKAKVLAGTGSNSTAEAITATQKAAALGVDGTLQVTPYYNKPPQSGLYAHFAAIATAAPELPMMLYNIPGRTGCKLEVETILRLAEIPNIVAVKDSTGDVGQVSELRLQAPENFAIYSGDDFMTLPLLAVGAVGVVSVASHVVGSLLKEMILSFTKGNVDQARLLHLKLMPLFRSLFVTTNPIPVKVALHLIGWPVGSVRSPLTPATPEVEALLRNVLQELALLP